MTRDELYNWLRLLLRMSSFIWIATPIAFWIGSYLFPIPPIKPDVIFVLLIGSIISIPISLMYRPVSIVVDDCARPRRKIDVTYELLSIGFHPNKTVDGFTSYSQPGTFGPFASRIVVGYRDGHYDVFGPYLEIRKLRRRLGV